MSSSHSSSLSISTVDIGRVKAIGKQATGGRCGATGLFVLRGNGDRHCLVFSFSEYLLRSRTENSDDLLIGTSDWIRVFLNPDRCHGASDGEYHPPPHTPPLRTSPFDSDVASSHNWIQEPMKMVKRRNRTVRAELLLSNPNANPNANLSASVLRRPIAGLISLLLGHPADWIPPEPPSPTMTCLVEAPLVLELLTRLPAPIC